MKASPVQPFHLAFPVRDIEEARHFYGEILGLPEGRSSETWIDFDLFGHQVVAHSGGQNLGTQLSNPVDGHDVPVPHFGVILEIPQWESLRDRLVAAEVQFEIEPYKRFEGQTGEQATMFFLDPSGNALEFKAFADISQLFAK
ncbi:VOC family protein [bacterium]|nr:VOC family protein [bacterium]